MGGGPDGGFIIGPIGAPGIPGTPPIPPGAGGGPAGAAFAAYTAATGIVASNIDMDAQKIMIRSRFFIGFIFLAGLPQGVQKSSKG